MSSTNKKPLFWFQCRVCDFDCDLFTPNDRLKPKRCPYKIFSANWKKSDGDYTLQKVGNDLSFVTQYTSCINCEKGEFVEVEDGCPVLVCNKNSPDLHEVDISDYCDQFKLRSDRDMVDDFMAL